jgi:UDP-3-O-[3-hydroxymyristoyl] glucosamine N-acyltransferase
MITIWGQVGTAGGVTIDKSRLLWANRSDKIRGGKSYFGTPIEESREKLKQLANIKKIPEILNKLK